MKRILSILIFSVISICLNAENVSIETAKTVAQIFLTSQGINAKSLELIYTASDFVNSSDVAETEMFYVFSNQPKGFIIVSADDAVLPILAYSGENEFMIENMPSNVSFWLNNYKRQINYVVKYNIPASDDVSELWQKLLAGNIVFQNNGTKAASLSLTTKWNQGSPYNQLCPTGTYTGCVATAMAQIMKFWNWPTTGTGSHSYISNENSYSLSANFGTTTYNWSNMPNQVSSSSSSTQKTAVATLIYHCGVSVNMDYDDTGSGALTSNPNNVFNVFGANYICAQYAFKTNFGYKTTIHSICKGGYWQQFSWFFGSAYISNDNTWISTLKAEIDAGRPFLYSGSDGATAGHAFVAYGYDNNNKFQINWGWSGYCDGYFAVNNLSPDGQGAGGGTGEYSVQQDCIIGIEPNGTPIIEMKVPASGNNSYTTCSGTIYDNGGSTAEYAANTNGYSILYPATTGAMVNISGSYDTELNYDFIYVYNGAGTTGTLLGTYSGSGSLNLTSTTGPLTIKFTSDPHLFGYGFAFNISCVSGNSDLSLYTAITTNQGTTLTQNSALTVSCNVANTGTGVFTGGVISADFYNTTNGNWISEIQEINIPTLATGAHYSSALSFNLASIDLTPGTYCIAIFYKPTGANEYIQLANGSYQNPITVTVQAPTISPDIYEVNNTVNQAYNFPLTFSNNSVNKKTTGSNFHISTDEDYYKVVLPTGYSYTLNPRLHDSYNSADGNTYTVDAMFSYSTNGTSWSETFDHVLTQSIYLSNGGTVFFHVAPYFQGNIGTYILEIPITRDVIININNIEFANIQVFPNPATNFFTIDLSNIKEEVENIKVHDILGQEILFKNNISQNVVYIETYNISEGTYFIEINTEKNKYTEKILIKR